MKRVLVLGATSGLAQSLLRELAPDRPALYLAARDPERLESVIQDLVARGARVIGSALVDLGSEAAATEWLDRAFEALEGPDLVLLAYGTLGDQAACEADPSLALDSLRVNFNSACRWLLELARRMEQQESGTLAAISSVAGERGRRSNYVYGAGKAGLNAFLSGLRARLAPAGVRVVTIKPGPVATAMLAGRPRPPLTIEAPRAGRLLRRMLEKGGHTIWLPGRWRCIMALIRLLPEFVFQKLKS